MKGGAQNVVFTRPGLYIATGLALVGVLLAIDWLGRVQLAQAAAPSGTLAGSPLTLNTGEISTINAFTYTDSGGEAVSSTDIRIRIPATLDAEWDTGNTALATGGSKQYQISTTSTQALFVSNKIVRLDVVKDFANTDTITISGLSMKGISSSGPVPLEFSIDGGATFGTAAVSTSVTVQRRRTTSDRTPPGAVTNVQLVSGSDGRSVTITWTNPSDADLATVTVYRATAQGALGAAIGETLTGTFTDSAVTPGTTYYYTLRPVDTNANEHIDATQYSITPTAVPPPPPVTPPVPTPTPPPEAAPPQPAPAPAPVPPPCAGETLVPGEVVKGSTPAVYSVGRDGMRHAFPNEVVFRTWFADFSSVRQVSDAGIACLPLGANVRMRPGTWLVKIVSDAKVYAVEPGGVLRRIRTEAIARSLYGVNWAALVRDVDPALFAGYTTGSDVSAVQYPLGSVLRNVATGLVYYVDQENDVRVIRQIIGDALQMNRFNRAFILDAEFSLPRGSRITGAEDRLNNPAM